MDARPAANPRGDGAGHPLVATLGLAANTFLAAVLIGAARLRETPFFWRNAGGYSEELRDLVKVGFPLLFVVDLLVVGLAALILLRALRVTPKLARIGLGLALIQVLLLAVVAGLALEDNLKNIWEGRPVHWHQDDQPP